MRHSDHESQRYIENVQSQINRKKNEMMGSARRAATSMVGPAVVDGLEMRVAPDDRGQHCKLEKLKNK